MSEDPREQGQEEVSNMTAKTSEHRKNNIGKEKTGPCVVGK